MDEIIFDSNYPIETPEGLSPVVELPEELNNKIVEPEKLRGMTCPTCAQFVKCKDPDFDYRVMKMHVKKVHGKDTVFPTIENFKAVIVEAPI